VLADSAVLQESRKPAIRARKTHKNCSSYRFTNKWSMDTLLVFLKQY